MSQLFPQLFSPNINQSSFYLTEQIKKFITQIQTAKKFFNFKYIHKCFEFIETFQYLLVQFFMILCFMIFNGEIKERDWGNSGQTNSSKSSEKRSLLKKNINKVFNDI
jgi:hypothetical protein